jgi:DNA-binding YbaB/EbfC family protein
MAMNRDMMAKLAQMQERLAKAQADLGEKRAEGTAGGGAVHIVVTGGMKVESLKIDKEVIDPDDAEMLEDLITAALNEALAKVQSLQMGQLAGLAGSLGIGGIPGLTG